MKDAAFLIGSLVIRGGIAIVGVLGTFSGSCNSIGILELKVSRFFNLHQCYGVLLIASAQFRLLVSVLYGVLVLSPPTPRRWEICTLTFLISLQIPPRTASSPGIRVLKDRFDSIILIIRATYRPIPSSINTSPIHRDAEIAPPRPRRPPMNCTGSGGSLTRVT